jgi:hypothetical protein
MKSWNNCEKISETGDIAKDVDGKKWGAFLKYLGTLSVANMSLKGPIWYDKETSVCFGPDQDFFSSRSEYSFYHQAENFTIYEPWGKEHLLNVLGQHISADCNIGSEAMFHNHPEFSKYKDSTILIVGAGPSAVDVDWEDEERDFTWSCTKFYLNDKLQDCGVDFASIGGNVDLEDPQFLSFISRHKTLCGFEGGVQPFKTPEQINKFKSSFPDQVSYFHTRYFSKLGSVARLIVFASLLGAKEVKFVGFDGNPIKQKHAFEGEQKSHDEVWRDSSSLNMYRRQFAIFWDYLLKMDNGVLYTNLGKNHPNNLTTDILE